MKRSLLLAAAALAALTLVAAGCGDSDEVPADAVAVVDGTAISKASLDELLARAKTSYTQQKREFPKAGTPEPRHARISALCRRHRSRQGAALGIGLSSNIPGGPHDQPHAA